MRFTVDAHPVRQIVVVGVAVVEKAAVLDHQAAGVEARSSRVPARGAFTGEPLDALRATPDVLAFLTFVYVVVVDPPPAMTHDIVGLGPDHGRDRRVLLEGEAHGVDRQRQRA